MVLLYLSEKSSVPTNFQCTLGFHVDQLVSPEHRRIPVALQDYFDVASQGATRDFPYRESCGVCLCSLLFKCNGICEPSAVLGSLGSRAGGCAGQLGLPHAGHSWFQLAPADPPCGRAQPHRYEWGASSEHT